MRTKLIVAAIAAALIAPPQAQAEIARIGEDGVVTCPSVDLLARFEENILAHRDAILNHDTAEMTAIAEEALRSGCVILPGGAVRLREALFKRQPLGLSRAVRATPSYKGRPNPLRPAARTSALSRQMRPPWSMDCPFLECRTGCPSLQHRRGHYFYLE